MSLFLAGLSAVLFGAGDFLGGLITRRVSVLTVVLWSQLAGLGLVVVLSPLVTTGAVAGRDLGWGAGAGLAGAAGLVVLYRGLASGRMSVVAPVTALAGAVVPLLFGLALGERPGVAAATGVGMALPAIALVSTSPSGGWRPSRWDLNHGLAAGVGFGLFFVLISRTGGGLWPLVSARVASLAVMFVLVAGLRGRRLRPPHRQLGQLAAVGLLDMSANIFFLLAVREGLLVLVAVLTSLYPAITVLLARLVLTERIHRVQGLGLALAGAGVALMAVG